MENTTYNLVERLQKRAEMSRQAAPHRATQYQEDELQKLADLLEEAAERILTLESYIYGT